MPVLSTTPQQRIAELERELTTRERVYPQWVRDGKITQPTADHRLQVLRDYRTRYPQPEQASLFTPDQLPPPCHPERSRRTYRPDDRPRHAFD
ncbi:MAG: hypothetical protein H7330_05200 [Hymenobacteraceae bacterium]|nr:hypothetical protein [Hymenobacteraceae bacterium]